MRTVQTARSLGYSECRALVNYVDIDSGVRHSREETLRYLEGLTKFSFRYGSARSYVLSPRVRVCDCPSELLFDTQRNKRDG